MHLPASPGPDVVLAADLNLADPPIRFDAVLDGVSHPMEHLLGTDRQGGWRVRIDIEPGCHTYYFEAENSDGQVGRFPQDGSYGWGSCDFDDPAAQWVAYQLEPDTPPSDPSDPSTPPAGTPLSAASPSGCGCQVGGNPASALSWGWLSVLLWRRRA